METMDFRRHIETAWNLTLKYIAPLILMTLVLAVVSGITLGILAPVTLAGYMQSLLLALREGREPKVQDLFSEMGLFFPLLGFAILFLVVTLVGFLLFFVPGLLFMLAASFFLLYMIPLMTDRDLGLFTALRESCRLSLEGPIADQIVAVVIFLGVSAVGQSVFVGFLFTQPLATLFLLSVYEDKVPPPGEALDRSGA
jgi:hypothetical protein